ncbi:MAG: glyoxalase [Acidimicrobiaceae bacterium]|nr:glyoxalase [Acidimicrobiaceae bacterium]
MNSRIVALDHVQLAMPAGREAAADAFYRDLLGFEVEEKPPHLAVRGGRWYARDAVRVHLGVEGEFRPARKAHPALLVEGLAELASALATAGHEPQWEGEDQCYVDDPFGNRIELLRATDS